MIRKSVQRFSEKITLNQKAKARWRFNPISSRFRKRSPRNWRRIIRNGDGILDARCAHVASPPNPCFSIHNVVTVAASPGTLLPHGRV